MTIRYNIRGCHIAEQINIVSLTDKYVSKMSNGTIQTEKPKPEIDKQALAEIKAIKDSQVKSGQIVKK